MNYTQIAGHLGKDPEIRFTPEGRKVTSFNVATKRKKKGQDITTWYRVTIWGDQFEKMMPYLKKGSPVVAVGELEARLYTDKEGRPQISLDITAWNIGFSPFGKPGSSEGGVQQKDEFSPSSSEPMRGSMQPSYMGAGSSLDSMDDNDQIPF